MKAYCFNCRKDAESKNRENSKKKMGRIVLLLECTVSDNKKSRFIKMRFILKTSDVKDENISCKLL